MRFLINNAALLLIPIISLFVIFSWFNEGKIISNNSEENLNIFNSKKTAQLDSSFWYPGGTGYKIAFRIPSYPASAVLGWFEEVGVSTFARQVILLTVLMMTGMFSIYLLLRKGFNLEKTIALIGSFFYFLNIYSMTQIWKRFIYSHIAAWAYLPIFLFFWIKWINTKKIIWLVSFLISSLFFTLAFSNPVFLLTFWAPAFIFILAKLLDQRKERKQVICILLRSFIGLLLWSVVNLWWLYPVLTLGSTWTAQTGQTWEGDFSSLQAVSKSFPLNEILLLRQSWYLGPDNSWNNFYHNPVVILINIGVLLTMLYGVAKSRGYPLRNFFLILGFIGLFISKGTNFPLGFTFFQLLFSKFPLTTALRNSYEKFGLVWLLPYTIFFAIGLYKLAFRFKNKTRHFFYIISLFLFCGILVLPIWNGDIFPQKHRLIVPNYYIEANNYLKEKSSQRIFSFPFLLELEKWIYSWGYVGEDPSESLFDPSSIAKPKLPYFDHLYVLFPELIYKPEFAKVLGVLGVSDVILHKDSIYPVIDLNKTMNIIENWQGVKSKKEFDMLIIYSLDKSLVYPQIFTANSFVHVQLPKDGILKIINDQIENKNTIFTTDLLPELKNAESPIIDFEKISNSFYRVYVKEAKGPFILVLNNAFDKSWQAKIGKSIVKEHFIANGFANGWIIEEKGDFKIEVKLVVWPWD